MKRIEDIEIMEADELESAALENGIPVPAGLEDRIKVVLAARSALRTSPKQPSSRWVPYAAVAVAASLAALAFLPRKDRVMLKDTYDNPYLADEGSETTFIFLDGKMSRTELDDLLAQAIKE